MPPCLIFEDDHLLVVNKPAGLNTHAPSPHAGEGIYDWLRHREPRWASLAIVHRLDKETSGVMVFAKTPLANRSLTEQFARRSVRKKYLLLTDRPFARKEVTVRSALVRVGDKYVSRPAHAGAELAETRFRPASGQGRQGGDRLAGLGRCRMLEAEPLTGRTHQIRVHAADQSSPILGDTRYGGTPAPRVCLHAAELTLRHPASGAELTFSAPVDFAADVKALLRAELIAPELTNGYRLVHGASDGWPGWFVDRLGDYLLSQSAQPLTAPQRAELERLMGASAARGAYHKLVTRQARRATAAEAAPQLALGQPAPERFCIRENGAQFELSFAEGYSVGLFLDQRDNRRRLLTRHVAAGFPLLPVYGDNRYFPLSRPAATLSPSDGERAGRGVATDSYQVPLPSGITQPTLHPRSSSFQVLNAFAYTCGFSVCAAIAGARTTSLDLSKKHLEWGKRNFALNQLAAAGHEFLFGEALDWLRRLAKKRQAYEVILLDPPTFSQSKASGVFRVEEDYGQLVAAALPLLKTGGVLFASTNAADWPPERFLEAVEGAIRSAGRKILQRHYVPQPPDFPISRAEPAYLKTVWLRLE